MIFSNRFDKIEILESLDETEFSKYSLSKEGWTTSISFTTPEKIEEYRYVTANNRLYTLTSFSQGEEGTEITAYSYASKKSETMTVSQKGTYTLLKLLERISPIVLCNLQNVEMPEIEIKEENKNLHDAIDECISKINGYTCIESILNTGDGLELYHIQLTMMGIGWGSYHNADVFLAIDEPETRLDSNPQYDKSYRISQSISNINSISDLRSWSQMSQPDYQKISDYISNDQSTVTESDASQILMNYIGFERANFEKKLDESFIINHLNEKEDDSIPYKVEDVQFSSFEVTTQNIIQNIFNQYQGFTLKNIETLQEVRDQIIISANDKMLYITDSYEIDCKNFMISSANFVLVATLEEFSD